MAVTKVLGLDLDKPKVGKRLSRLKKWFRVGSAGVCVLGDGFVIIAAALLAAAVRFQTLDTANTRDLTMVILPSYFLAAFVFRSYTVSNLVNTISSVSRTIMAISVAVALTAIAAFAFKVGSNYSRLESGYMVLAAILLLTGWRTFLAFALSRYRQLIQPSTVLLTDDTSYVVPDGIVELNLRSFSNAPTPNDPDFLEHLYKKLQSYDQVVLSFRSTKARETWVDLMRRTGLQAEVLEPHFSGMRLLGVGWFEGTPTVVISRGPLTLPERLTKRVFDAPTRTLLLPLLCPIFCVIALAIKSESRGPVFFVQRRVGRNNRQFKCFKFRTMRVEFEDKDGTRSASRDDERLTRVGSFLRKTSLDELPQLLNVLKGEMSLVGPRPHALGSTADGERFWNITHTYWLRHSIKPGMTGLAQVRGFRGATLTRDELAQRVAADLEYVNNWSLWLDIKILLQTPTVLLHGNAY